MVNKKHPFWQALLVAVLVFGIGMIGGIYFENSRAEKIQSNLLSSEINLMDSQLIGEVSDNFNLSCEVRRQNIIDFADRIYIEAQLLEEYDDSSQLTNILKVVHKRYDLLRVLLWKEAISYNSNCGEKLKTVIYLYKYNNPDSLTKSKQVAFGRYLEDLKLEYGNNFVLIPIAGDLDLSSINLIEASYGIKEFPDIIVNDKIVINDIANLFDVEKQLFG